MSQMVVAVVEIGMYGEKTRICDCVRLLCRQTECPITHTHMWPLIKDHFGIFQLFHIPKQILTVHVGRSLLHPSIVKWLTHPLMRHLDWSRDNDWFHINLPISFILYFIFHHMSYQIFKYFYLIQNICDFS